MALVVFGLNHKSAPIELREDVGRVIVQNQEFLAEFSGLEAVEEVLVLSTCNRVEIYGVLVTENCENYLLDWLLQKSKRSLESGHYYFYQGEGVVHHLFRVVSSLDSMIIGENQIVSQFRDAYRLADQTRTLGAILRRMVDKALMVAKKIRSQTAISAEGVSIGRAGLDLASQVLGDLRKKKALLIGAGEHGEVIAKNMISRGIGSVVIANRTLSRAENLALELDAKAIPLDEIPTVLPKIDVVLTSVGGGQTILSKTQVQQALRRRFFSPMVLIDLSVPRVLDLAIHDVSDAYLFDVDDLRQLAGIGLEKRKIEAEKAEMIIERESSRTWDILNSDQHNRKIGEIFQQAEEIRKREIEKLSQQIQLDSISSEAVEKMSKSLIKRLLHNPVLELHHLLREQRAEEAEILLNALLGEQKR